MFKNKFIFIMKKFLFLLMALAAIVPARADRYLTIGVNDTLRVNPIYLTTGVLPITFRAHFDGRANVLDMTLRLPCGMELMDASMGDDMLYIPYENEDGDLDTCSAQFFYQDIYDYDSNTHTDSLSASIITLGYWNSSLNGQRVTYGMVKWEPGDYDDMFTARFLLNENFTDTATIRVKQHLGATPDQRCITIPETVITKSFFLYVGYQIGDVDGNEAVNIADVTALIDYVRYREGLDKYQLAAADVDGDGIIGIADVTALNDIVSGNS